MSQTPDQNPTTIQARFKCNSGDKAELIVDAPSTYPGDVTISLSYPSRFIIVTPAVARQIATAIIQCADEAAINAALSGTEQ